MRTFDLIVVGGGAAGVFASIIAKTLHPTFSVLILEKTHTPLSKVRVSGGGRCNVTNACFDPKKLIQNYPRGGKELLGPFHSFQPKDMMEWLESHGVKLKQEAHGRVFPVSNSSETIIKCFLAELEKLHIGVDYTVEIDSIKKDSCFEISSQKNAYYCHNLLLATGSSPKGYEFAKSFGHTIVTPIPSLFPLNLSTFPFQELSGVAVDPVELKIPLTKFCAEGSLLLTHTGISGPVTLELSSKAARHLYEKNYKDSLVINWLPKLTQEEIFEKLLSKDKSFLPKSLIKKLFGPLFEKKAPSLKELHLLAERLHRDTYFIEGKNPSEGEFVACGGVSLREVNFRNMESKLCPHLFFAGEILDIDGFTGGFNLQNAWTTAYRMGSSIYTETS